jgi:hypothetical protein
MPSRSSRIEHVRLGNDALQITVLPELGAKIFDFIHLPSAQNFLWHNPRIEPQRYPVDANFDNYWCGGWDDGFPTCETCSHNGELYPNLGELRSLAWRLEMAGPAFAQLSADGPISPVRASKEIRLVEDALEMRFSIRHVCHAPIEFIWGTHPAHAITPDCLLHIPARKGLVGQANHLILGEPGQSYEWPIVKSSQGSMDMSRVLPPGPSLLDIMRPNLPRAGTQSSIREGGPASSSNFRSMSVHICGYGLAMEGGAATTLRSSNLGAVAQ